MVTESTASRAFVIRTVACSVGARLTASLRARLDAPCRGAKNIENLESME
jgi:hypothetical protein